MAEKAKEFVAGDEVYHGNLPEGVLQEGMKEKAAAFVASGEIYQGVKPVGAHHDH